VDDGDFHRLNRRLARFNLFEAVGAVRAELRHSNFLAFIFSPARSHGLGSVPLEKCLRAILESIPPEDRPVRTLELVVGDLDDAVVHRERDNIDLLIEVRSLNLVVMIENKVGAAAGDGQLARYKEVVEQRFPGWRHLFVFLTPDGIDPDCPGFVPFSYRRLAQVLEGISDDELLPTDARLILSHYVEMLRRHIVPDDDLRELALRLYERHREAFEFVFEARPQPRGLLDVMQGCIKGVEGLAEDRHGTNILRFFPANWDELFDAFQCSPTKWTRTGRGLLFEIKAAPTGRIHIALILGPCESEVRKLVYAEALKRPVFKGVAKPMGLQWATIYSRDLLTSAQAQNMEFEAQSFAVQAAWSDFHSHDLMPLIAEIEAIAKQIEDFTEA